MTLCTQYAPVMVSAFSKIQKSWENLSESESYTQATNTNIAVAIKISQIIEWCYLRVMMLLFLFYKLA